MDWKTFIATFGAIFVAELADKTQLVGIAMSAESKKPVSVLLGSVSAYIVITAVSVMIGVLAGKYLKPELIRYFGGGLFIILGFLMLAGKI
ncbi:MAG: TMEM165/GDT1 family protein [Candidatus Omnitrophica bacterium]|nr:TMEM165/GDT1 family protein [Candidatus Omnitrophota bacterium]